MTPAHLHAVPDPADDDGMDAAPKPKRRKRHVRKRTDGSKAYPYRFTDPRTGKRRQVTFDTAKQLDDFKADLREQRRGGRKVVDEKVTVRDAVRVAWELHIASLADATQDAHRANITKRIVPWMGELQLARVDRSAVAEFQAWLRKGGDVRHCRRAAGPEDGRLVPFSKFETIDADHGDRKAASTAVVNSTLRTLSLVLGQAEAHFPGFVAPTDKVRKRKEETREAIIYEPWVIASIADCVRLERDRAMIALGAFGGLRQGEIRQLRWSDVDMRDGWIVVRRGTNPDRSEKSTKATVQRRVPIFPPLRDALERWRLHAPALTGLVAPNQDGVVLDKSKWITRVWRRSCVRAARAVEWSSAERAAVLPLGSVERREALARGAELAASVAGARFHDTRHTFVSLCAAAGVPMHLAMTWAGHQDERTHRRYKHLFDRQIREVIAQAGDRIVAWMTPDDSCGQNADAPQIHHMTGDDAP